METETENKTEIKKAEMRNALLAAFDDAWAEHVGELIRDDRISLDPCGFIYILDDNSERVAQRKLDDILSEYAGFWDTCEPDEISTMAGKLERLAKQLRAIPKKKRIGKRKLRSC